MNMEYDEIFQRIGYEYIFYRLLMKKEKLLGKFNNIIGYVYGNIELRIECEEFEQVCVNV